MIESALQVCYEIQLQLYKKTYIKSTVISMVQRSEASLKKKDFKSLLKQSTVFALRISTGRAFHSFDADVVNALSSRVVYVLPNGGFNKSFLFDLRGYYLPVVDDLIIINSAI